MLFKPNITAASTGRGWKLDMQCFLMRVPLAYDYENEGFELDQSRCLVDFWLPTLGIFFEVKGSLLVGWQHKYQSLADHSERRVVVAEGGIHSKLACSPSRPAAADT